jgi:hypothetical protein
MERYLLSPRRSPLRFLGSRRSGGTLESCPTLSVLFRSFRVDCFAPQWLTMALLSSLRPACVKCAISSLIFTYIFSSLADSHALSQFPPVIGIPEEPARSVVCAGKGCFEGTMWIAMGSSILGGVVLWWIGRGWKARGV